MAEDLNDRERAIIQMILVDRWNPHRLDQKIASHFTLTLDQVHDIRQQPAFLEELARQSEISEQPFVNLADRKVRVVALQQLFEKVPDVRVALRLKIRTQIRKEAFDAKFPLSMRRMQWTILHLQSRHTANGSRSKADWPSEGEADSDLMAVGVAYTTHKKCLLVTLSCYLGELRGA
jgi:hypothetical protein